MADMASATGTGHSPVRERYIAKILYGFIALAVVVGLALAFTLGKTNKAMNPYEAGQADKAAPDSLPAKSAPDGSAPGTNPTTSN